MASDAIKTALKAAPDKTMKVKNLQNKVMNGTVTKAQFKEALAELTDMGRVTIEGKLARLEKKTKAMKRKSGGDGGPPAKKNRVATKEAAILHPCAPRIDSRHVRVSVE